MRNQDSHIPALPRQDSNCRRCGICCLKGGPALHQEDLALLKNATIKRSQLVTLCVGELAFTPQPAAEINSSSNPSDSLSLQPLSHEVIKIKGKGVPQAYPHTQNIWTCVFFQSATAEQPLEPNHAHQDAACLLHPDHPMECRLLDCQDPSRLLSAYAQSRLNRADISSPTEQAIQQAHAEGLRWDTLGPDLATAKTKFDLDSTSYLEAKRHNFLPPKLERAILEAARFDQAFRELLLERGKQYSGANDTPEKNPQEGRAKKQDTVPLITDDELPFHLGRPVPELLQQFSLYISADARMIFYRSNSSS